MLDAAQASARFFCPGCGAALRAPRADAGSSIDCHLCGESVRVPRRPHPLESEPDSTPLIPPAAAAEARRGCRLLTLSLAASVAEYAVLAAALVTWAALRGPARIAAGDAGDLRPALYAAWAAHVVLIITRTCLRCNGYRRVGAAATAVRAGGWIASAWVGAILRPVGYVVVCLPLVVVPPSSRAAPSVLHALADIGLFAWATGIVLELGVLFAWSRLLTEVSGKDAARRVARYAATVAVAVVTLLGGACLAAIVTVLAHRRTDPPRPNPDELPPEGWYAAAALLLVAAGFGVVLAWQYFRILRAARAGLARS